MITHKSPISCVSSLYKKYIITAGYDNQVILWDIKNGKSVSRGFHDHLANQCEFSPCGKYAVSTSSDYSSRIWHVPSMKLAAVLFGHTDDVEGVAFHPYKQLIATCSRDKTICIFDYNGSLLSRLHGHTADVISITWEKNDDVVISSSDDGTIKKWDVETGAILRNIDLGGAETDTVVVLDNGVILAGNDNGEIIIIEEGSIKPIKAHEAGIKRLVYDRKTDVVISLSYDRRVNIWMLSNANLELIVSSSLPETVWPRSCTVYDEGKIAFSTFGDRYATFDYKLNNWEFNKVENTFGLNASYSVGDIIYRVGDSGIVSDSLGEKYALGSLCNFIIEYEGLIVTGGQTGVIFDALNKLSVYQHRSPLNCAAIFETNEGKRLIVGSYTGEGIILSKDINGFLKFETTVKLHDNAIKGLAAFGKEVFSVCADTSVTFYNAEKKEIVKSIKNAHDKIANGCAYDGRGGFVSISRDLNLYIWTDMTAEKIRTPSENSIKCISVSFCSNYICIGNYTGWVGVYDRTERKWILWCRESASGISSLHYNKYLGFVATSYDGSINYISI